MRLYVSNDVDRGRGGTEKVDREERLKRKEEGSC